MIIEDITFFTRLGDLLDRYEPVHLASGPVIRENRGLRGRVDVFLGFSDILWPRSQAVSDPSDTGLCTVRVNVKRCNYAHRVWSF